MLVADYVTTGDKALVVGSTYQFTLSLKFNHLYQDLTGATVTLNVKDPTGTITSYTATITNGVATSQSIVFASAIAGTWTRSWAITLNTVPYVTPPIGFTVANSP